MYDKSLLAKGTSASLVVVGLIVVLMLHTGTAYAVPMAGVGGFTITADEIRGETAEIYVGAGNTSTESGVPMAVTELSSSEIDGLQISKELDVGEMPGVTGNARIVISGNGTVTTGRQLLKATEVQADEAVLRGQTLDESPAANPRNRFTITATGTEEKPGMVLKDAEITAHYLTTNRITIPDQKITVEYDPDDDGDYERSLD
jgi:putative alpha-1,2-mannosidase